MSIWITSVDPPLGIVKLVVEVKVISVAEPLLPPLAVNTPFKVVNVGGITCPPNVFVPQPKPYPWVTGPIS